MLIGYVQLPVANGHKIAQTDIHYLLTSTSVSNYSDCSL